MRSINRVLALTAFLALAAAGSASAAWHPEENGPRFAWSSHSAPTTVASDQPISMAPKKYVAETRPFYKYSGHRAPSYAKRCSTTKPFVCPRHRTDATETTTRGR